ncbi:MAG: hypothetical protein C0518_06835 [Opitutus sp.]|nr:hypothetical protein [Opitutus sp.]
MLQLGCFEEYLMTFDSHVRLDAFLGILPRLSARRYWTLLRDVWISAEVTLPQKQAWLDLLQAAQPEREAFMICSERRFLKRLPEVLTIYRGCGHVDGVFGLSWTLSYERAKFFAAYSCGPRRRILCPGQAGQWPVLAKATCSKADVIAYLAHRKEKEIVVDPSKISLLHATEWRPREP